MQPSLGIKNVLAPRLIETDRNLMSARLDCPFTISTEAPRTKKPRAARGAETMVVEAGRKRRRFPAAGIEMNLVPVGDQAAGQVRNVRAASPAGRKNLIVA